MYCAAEGPYSQKHAIIYVLLAGIQVLRKVENKSDRISSGEEVGTIGAVAGQFCLNIHTRESGSARQHEFELAPARR